MANILAVDDNLELCKLIRTTLERDGHRVETRQAGGALTEPLCRWADCILLGILLLVGAVVWSTHRTGRFLTRETEKLTAAAQAVARKELDSAVFSGAKVREYESALQALQTMGDALTGSLQKQWAMEQRQREQIIQLSHKLKTPLTIIEGNAELLAEDDGLTAEQKAQVESILQGAEQTRTYLGKIRAEVQTPLRYKRNVE